MDIQDIANEALAVLGTGRQVAPFSGRHPDFGLEEAYRVAAAVRAQRETRGERPVGGGCAIRRAPASLARRARSAKMRSAMSRIDACGTR